MSRFALFGAFSRWRERIVQTREVSIAKRRANVVVERFVRRASRRELSRAFNRGVESTASRRARRSLRKVVARWQRLRLRALRRLGRVGGGGEEQPAENFEVRPPPSQGDGHRRMGAMDRSYRRVETAEGARGEGVEVPGATGESHRGPRVCPVERLCRSRLEASRRSAQNRDQVAAPAAVGAIQRLGRLGRRGASEPPQTQQVLAPHANSQDCRGVCSMGRESRGDERQRHVMRRAEGYSRGPTLRCSPRLSTRGQRTPRGQNVTATCLRRSSADGSAYSWRRSTIGLKPMRCVRVKLSRFLPHAHGSDCLRVCDLAR